MRGGSRSLWLRSRPVRYRKVLPGWHQLPAQFVRRVYGRHRQPGRSPDTSCTASARGRPGGGATPPRGEPASHRCGCPRGRRWCGSLVARSWRRPRRGRPKASDDGGRPLSRLAMEVGAADARRMSSDVDRRRSGRRSHPYPPAGGLIAFEHTHAMTARSQSTRRDGRSGCRCSSCSSHTDAFLSGRSPSPSR